MGAGVFLPESWDKRKFICPSMMLMAVFSLLVGPSCIFHLPDNPYVVGVGIFLTEGARGVSMALCPSDAIAGGIKRFPLDSVKVSDFVSSFYSFLFGVCTFIFPIIGSALVEHLGFRAAIDSISGVLLVNSTLYFVSCLSDWKQESREMIKHEAIAHTMDDEEGALLQLQR